jgi:pimeloyl-ACP methyl ester carboxylesterase
MEQVDGVEVGKHFVLVHGACHGAWVWYKLKPRLESAGHRVTALDLSASGINPKSLQDLRSLDDYSLPLLELMDSVPENEKVILVGHSLGGMNLALAMDKYAHKISVAVFVTAFMPDTVHVPSYVIDELLTRKSKEFWLDTQYSSFGSTENPLTSLLFGPKFTSSMLYQQCSPEDVELAITLMRNSSLFREDLAKANKFTNEGFGSVKRVYIVCEEDKAITKDLQEWFIENNPVEEVYEIEGADHMAMLSKTDQLFQLLLQIGAKHAN